MRNCPRVRSSVSLFTLAWAVLLAATPSLRAYDSFEWWSKAAHYEMLQKALSPLGFQPEAIDAIRLGADGQDAVVSKKFTASPDHHCDDNTLSQAWAYIQERMATFVQMAQDGPRSPDLADPTGIARNALYTLGEGLHTSQDFYCHSNYLEWVLANGRPFRPVDWNNRPAGVKSGQFYWFRLYSNEATTIFKPPAGLVNGRDNRLFMAVFMPEIGKIDLQRQAAIRLIGGQFRYHTRDEFLERITYPDYQLALNYATDDLDVLHYEINKDSEESMQGRIIAPDGQTLFDKSRDLAMLETAARWKAVEDQLLSDPATKPTAPWVLAAAKGRALPEVARAVLRPMARVAPGETLSGELALLIRNLRGLTYDPARGLTVRARLNLTTTPGLGQAMKVWPEGEPGLSDGATIVPLQALALKAPAEPCTLTLKLEATLLDDPRTTLCTAEATVEVTKDAPTTPGSVAGKGLWLRGEPVITGFGDPALAATALGLSYQGTDAAGKPASNTLKWDAPPARLRDGDPVVLSMTASAAPGAAVGGWYNLGEASLRSDPPVSGSLNGAGSAGNWRLPESGGSPHQGTLRFKFRPGYEPWIQVSAGHDPNTKTWGLITWRYHQVADDGKPSGSTGAGADTPTTPGAAPTDTFAGSWRTTWGDWGDIILKQEGQHVTGSYGNGMGTLEGDIKNGVLLLTWKDRGGALWGGAKFTLSADGKTMKGSRNDYGKPEVEQYRWDAARQ